MSLGRSPWIPKTVADRVEHPLESRSLSTDIHRAPSPNQPPFFNFFVAFCKLHRILGDILESLYADGEENQPNRVGSSFISVTKLDKIFQIEQNLSQWSDEMETSLQRPFVGSNFIESQHDTRQINILHARYVWDSIYGPVSPMLIEDSYFYIQMLLYRSFVSQARKFGTFSDVIPRLNTSTVSQRVVAECQVSCIEAARQLIGNLYDNLPANDRVHDHDVLPEWWNVLSCELHKPVCDEHAVF